MATTTLHTAAHHSSIFPSAHRSLTTAYVSNWAVVLGRTLFSLIFILSSYTHFQNDAINMAMDQGVPFASLLVPFSGVIALFGGLSILLGYKEKIGAALIMLFLVPVTLMMHHFWTETDPGLHMMQQANFMKNVAIFGAAMLIYQYAPSPFPKKVKPIEPMSGETTRLFTN